MVDEAEEARIRLLALRWLDLATNHGELPLAREQLANDFLVDGQRFPLIDRGRGIRRPRGWRAALSITTAVPEGRGFRPYDDSVGPDGLQRYKLRADRGGSVENAGLRAARDLDLPVAWFVGIQVGLYQVISPVYLIREEQELSQFVLAITEAQRIVPTTSVVEERLCRYLDRETRQRLHQPIFASQVMIAYEERCAVCALHHRELLDAAHIISDAKPHGLPIVSNGLALCKIHHAAYDRNILGIRPDLVVEINQRMLLEQDGPMLEYGLKARHGQTLMKVPARRGDQPDPTRLEERYEEFRVA